MHPDFGGDVSPGSAQVYGFPYAVVDSTVTKRAVQFQDSDESDGVDHATNLSVPFYPIPDEAITQAHWIEGGDRGNIDLRSTSDRHLLIVDRDRRHLYELYNVFYDGSQWHAGSGAFFDLGANARRPDGWTSADAAGLAILPGLVRYDEVFGSSEIASRASRDRTGHERVRVPGIAPRGVNDGRAADGRAPAAEGEPQHLGVHARGAEDVPRHETIRSDCGGQRLGSVCERHL